jgi:hypothetical protein
MNGAAVTIDAPVAPFALSPAICVHPCSSVVHHPFA